MLKNTISSTENGDDSENEKRDKSESDKLSESEGVSDKNDIEVDSALSDFRKKVENICEFDNILNENVADESATMSNADENFTTLKSLLVIGKVDNTRAASTAQNKRAASTSPISPNDIHSTPSTSKMTRDEQP